MGFEWDLERTYNGPGTDLERTWNGITTDLLYTGTSTLIQNAKAE